MKDEPALPGVAYEKPAEAYGTSVMTIVGGLTKREYFAGLAMQGLYAVGEAHFRAIVKEGLNHGESRTSRTFAREAVEQADALLAELEKDVKP